MLYEDAGIVGTVVDSDLPADDPGLRLIPGRVLRLFQMSPAIKKLLPAAGSFGELRHAYQGSLDRAVRHDGIVGVKSHLAEEAGFGAPFCPDAEAESVFGAAQAGDGAAYKRLYMALFQATLLQAQDLDIPVHLHSGITGGFWNGPVADADPFLLMPLLRRHEFLASRVVLLHGAYPWMQHAAMMAHALPHLWVDVGWTSPWASLRIVECYRDLIGLAPLSKLMVGSGSHGTPEISWLAGITAKIALAKALGDAVELGLMASRQAEDAARLILHDNAARLYKLA
jgi:predicted TIM-barrel fold metal-dependent hydrolase